MNRRSIISLVCSAILIIVTTSCVYQSGRNSEANNSQTNADNSDAANASKVNKTTENKKSDDGDFLVEHLAVSNARYGEIDRQIKEEKLIEKAADRLNRSLILPHDIKLITKDCAGEINAFYDANERSVTVCYELMEHFYKTFRADNSSEQEAYRRMFDAVRFAFLHEIGHALIDVYNLPITGSEEDAADRCSSFINLTELGEDGVNAVFAAADAFAVESKKPSNKSNLADDHLLQEQRFYNSLCMIYGSNTTKYAYILEEKYLPRERALKCPQEYERMVDSWKVLLAPWRKT